MLKVIIETCYLTKEEKIAMCHAVTEAKADFIKTSTGFGTGGATFEDVALMAEHIGKDVKIKAAGGVRSKEDMERYIAAWMQQDRNKFGDQDVRRKRSIMNNSVISRETLIGEAYEAKKNAYVPYSNFPSELRF